MDDKLARHLVRTAFRASRDLQETLSLLKRQLTDDEYKPYAVAVAAAVDAINLALIERPLTGRPDLRAEIEESLGRHGRYL